MDHLKTIPAALASLVLGAHFLRSGSLLLVLYCLVLVVLCFIRKPLPRAIARYSLTTGVLVWIWTTYRIVGAKLDTGQPAGRSLAILLGVAIFTAISVWLLQPVEPPATVEPD